MRAEPPIIPPSPRQAQPASLRELSGEELDAQLRKRIEQRIEDRNGFIYNLIAFVGIVPVLWYIWASAGPADLVWPLFVTLPWLVGLIIHGMVVYQGSGIAVARREQKILREMQLEKDRLGITGEKPKRSSKMRLADDGELVPADADEDEFDSESAKLKHNAL